MNQLSNYELRLEAELLSVGGRPKAAAVYRELLAYREAEKAPLGYSDIHSIKKLKAGVSFLIPVNQTLDSYFSVPVFSGPVLNKAQGVSADFVVIDEIEEQKNKLSASPKLSPTAIPQEWRESLQELVTAMRHYEMDVDEEAPNKHKAMMRRATALLSASPVLSQPVPDELPEPQDSCAGYYRDGWNDCRAAVLSASPVLGQTPALTDVIAERQRQISVEGRTLERDDNYKDGSMAVAAACYARLGGMWNDSWQVTYTAIDTPSNWPWPNEWWKPTNPRRDLVKAAALILAEIERLDRAAIAKATGESE